MTMNADEAEEAAFKEHEAPSWEVAPVARDAAVRWHLRGFQAGVEFARRSETLVAIVEPQQLSHALDALDDGADFQDAIDTGSIRRVVKALRDILAATPGENREEQGNG